MDPNTKLELIANALTRRLHADLAGYFPNASAKHNHYLDYGWPEILTFDMLYGLYKRNGLAFAGVSKTIKKTWEDNPWLLQGDDVHPETSVEKAIRKRFERIGFWRQLAGADRRSMVGNYGALIFRFGDGKTFDQPVGTVSGGLDGLVEIIPCWQAQLQPSIWDTDPKSQNYGKPLMYEFREQMPQDTTGQQQQKLRQFNVHPDRVHIWSETGDIYGQSALEPGFNSLIDYEKVSGAGGEGFWKNAKQAMVLSVDKDANLNVLAQTLGVPVEGLRDKLDEVFGDWQKGFDQLLMLQGIQHDSPSISLPQPKEFMEGPVAAFAASLEIPVKILLGSQTGERASQEDADEWARTCMSRRSLTAIPNIRAIVEKLERYRILPPADWHIDWSDLTEASAKEKMERAKAMSETNRNMAGTGEPVPYRTNEIREVTGHEPIDDVGGFGELDDFDVNSKQAIPRPRGRIRVAL
jgi:hypothetical protein